MSNSESGNQPVVKYARMERKESGLIEDVEPTDCSSNVNNSVTIEKSKFLNYEICHSIVSEYDTPVYVYSEAMLRQHANNALSFPHPYGLTVRFAMKACPNVSVLQLFDSMGIQVDCSSGYEVLRALKAGVLPSHISISSQELPPIRLLEHIVKAGVKFNACSLHQLEMYGRLFPNTSCGVRFNPGRGSGGTSKTNVGGPSASFGVWYEQKGVVKAIAQAARLTIERIHTHIGSGSDPLVWKRVCSMSLSIVQEFPEVHTLNLGGGFKVGRMSYEKSTDLQDVGASVFKELEAFYVSTGRQLHLEIEPGTYLVANAGSLLSVVQDIVCTGSEYPYEWGSSCNFERNNQPFSSGNTSERIVGRSETSNNNMINMGEADPSTQPYGFRDWSPNVVLAGNGGVGDDTMSLVPVLSLTTSTIDESSAPVVVSMTSPDPVVGNSLGYTFIKLNCGMTDILRPSLYGAQHPIVVHSPPVIPSCPASTPAMIRKQGLTLQNQGLPLLSSSSVPIFSDHGEVTIIDSVVPVNERTDNEQIIGVEVNSNKVRGPVADEGIGEYIVVGHCCESGDLLTCHPNDSDSLLPRYLHIAHIGDYVSIEGAGAYCSSMACKNYNSFPEAAEVMIDLKGNIHCIRRRQTLEQMLQNEVSKFPSLHTFSSSYHNSTEAVEEGDQVEGAIEDNESRSNANIDAD